MSIMNRRLILAGLAAAIAAPQMITQALAQDLRPRLADPTPGPVIVALEGAERAAAVASVNAALNAVERMQGRFVQTSPGGGSASGSFYLQRPGRLRFEYDPPATLLIISDGSVVSLRDTALRTTQRTPLRSTPLNLILRTDIDLERHARVLRVARSGDWLMVTARDRSGQTDGQITLNFRGGDLQLTSWDVYDATGARTRVTLSDVEHPGTLEPSLFRVPDVLTDRPRGRP
jgi:outer membrane lipoprotein-sorting protein